MPNIRRNVYTGNTGFTNEQNYQDLLNMQHMKNVAMPSPVTLDYFGEEQCAPGYYFGPFVRTSYLIHFVRSGKGLLVKNGRNYQVKAGQAFLIYPGETTVYHADSEDPWSYMWVGFHGFMSEEITEQAGFDRAAPVREISGEVLRYMEELINNSGKTFEARLRRMSALYGVLAALVQGSGGIGVITDKTGMQDISTDELYVRTAVNTITNSYSEKLKVAEIADRIGISRNYLTAVFKKSMHMSPQEFLVNYRMEAAAEFLIGSASPVGLVAAKVGYSDQLSFSKAFRKRYGMSPSEYRKRRFEKPDELPTC